MAHAAFNWQDPFLLQSQLSDDERMVREAAEAYCQDKLLPRVTEAFRNGTTDVAIFREMGELGLLGPTLPAFLTPLTSAFLHGGWLHLTFNMIMLLFIGRQLEAPA